MSNDKVLNIAIIGLGSIGRRHIVAAAQIDNINLSGVVDVSSDAENFCKSNEIPFFNNLKALTNDIHIDGV